MPKQRPGFPEALFDTYDELVDLVLTKARLRDQQDEKVLDFLLHGELSIGRLREADPILGDLTLYARDAIDEVVDRLEQLAGATSETGGVPLS